MNYWTFIWTAYGLTLSAMIALLVQTMLAMRAAENGAQRSGDAK